MAHHPHAPYRIWVAGESEWLPGPSFPDLESALSNARKLALAGDVALELPTRQWHTFTESGSNRLGPAQLAKGSDPNLTDRANAAVGHHDSHDASTSRAYKLTLSRSQVKTAGGTMPGMGDARIATGTERRSERIARVTGTNPGLGPSDARRSGRVRTQRASTRTSGVYLSTGAGDAPQQVKRRATAPITSQPAPSERRAKRRATHTGPERRESKRYDASDVLEEPACSIQSHRTEIVDVSETGLQLMVPAGVRVQIGRPVTLVFSGKQGCFEIQARGQWARGRYAGVHIEKAGGNVVGRMFLRKMIARHIEREKKRKERQKRRGGH